MSGLYPAAPWHLEPAQDGTLVRFTCPALDETNAANLAAQLAELGRQRRSVNLYLDLSAVDVLSSAVLGQLIVLHRRLRDANGGLSLFNLRPGVAALLKMSLLTELLDVRVIPLPPRTP